jgi:hypothetical protein
VKALVRVFVFSDGRSSPAASIDVGMHEILEPLLARALGSSHHAQCFTWKWNGLLVEKCMTPWDFARGWGSIEVIASRGFCLHCRRGVFHICDCQQCGFAVCIACLAGDVDVTWCYRTEHDSEPRGIRGSFVGQGTPISFFGLLRPFVSLVFVIGGADEDADDRCPG